jgi:hypothetical protein
VHFNPKALLLLIGFFVLLGLSLWSGSGWMHVAEAITTVLIALGVAGLLRDRLNTHQ